MSDAIGSLRLAVGRELAVDGSTARGERCLEQASTMAAEAQAGPRQGEGTAEARPGELGARRQGRRESRREGRRAVCSPSLFAWRKSGGGGDSGSDKRPLTRPLSSPPPAPRARPLSPRRAGTDRLERSAPCRHHAWLVSIDAVAETGHPCLSGVWGRGRREGRDEASRCRAPTPARACAQ